jgi:hypothetical protein
MLSLIRKLDISLVNELTSIKFSIFIDIAKVDFTNVVWLLVKVK